MLKQLSILAVAGLASTAVATKLGNISVTNKCGFPVTLWSVGSNISSPHTLAKNGGTYGEQYTRDPETGGRALKITKDSNGIYAGKAQTIFAYTLDPNAVWYDLSDVFGDQFAGSKLEVVPTNKQCGSIVWDGGSPPAGSQVKVCTRDADVKLTLCA